MSLKKMSQKSKTMISIIIPVYQEQDVIEKCMTTIENEVILKLPDMKFEVLFVNDGSTDQTQTILQVLAQKKPLVRAIHFSRNFGHQAALLAGYQFCRGDCAVTIDSDLQDPPSVIIEMIQKWQDGYQIVYARRAERQGESIFKKISAMAFYRILQTLSPTRIPIDSGDFRLIDAEVIQQIRNLKERTIFLRAMIAWFGYPSTEITYVRHPRFAGETKYSLSKMLSLALSGICSFSGKPLVIATYLGFFAIFACLFASGYVFYSKWILKNTISGWASLAILLTFFNGIQFLVIGIIGQYIGKIYEEIKERPSYIVQEDTQ